MMTLKGRWALLSLLILIPPIARAQDCDCTSWPFRPDPPCFDMCAVTFLLEADPQRLQEVLDLPDQISDRLIELRQNAQLPKKLSDAFDQATEQYLEERLRNLGADEFEYSFGEVESD